MKAQLAIIAESIDYLVAHYQEQPDLSSLARRAGYDAPHFQKLFRRSVGISPKRLVQYMTMRHAGELLAAGQRTLDAADETGLSGNGRLHDLMVSCAGVTPGQVQGRGRGLNIIYGIAASPLGRLIIARTDKGICWLGFMVDESESACIRRIQCHFPLAGLKRDDAAVQEEAAHISALWQGQTAGNKPLMLDLYGTNFQVQVWQALLRIPCGETVDYQSIARDVGRPSASRAVGNAVGANPVSLIIPCHRVIRASGIIDNYGWGSARKKVLLGLEVGEKRQI